MNMDVNELRGILNGYFDWNKARLTCFVSMLLALIKVRTINLTELAVGFESEATVNSRYRRIKRFFKEMEIGLPRVAVWVVQLFGLSGERLYLSMDRTNWQWGKKNINILMLSIAYKGIAIPLFWRLLDKKGNSDTAERIELMQRFIAQFGKDKIEVLLADREFVGKNWFHWLKSEQISFVIRIKKNLLTTDSRGREVRVENLFRGLKPLEERIIYAQRMLLGEAVYLSALKMPDGELLIVATDTLPGFSIKKYARRWEIETLFGCLKSKGFNFEDTHVTHSQRIEKLLVLLTIAFCWAHKTGEWRHEQKAIEIKAHGRKAVSYFRYGLDILRDLVLNPKNHCA
jgi:Transposase DDE domain